MAKKNANNVEVVCVRWVHKRDSQLSNHFNLLFRRQLQELSASAKKEKHRNAAHLRTLVQRCREGLCTAVGLLRICQDRS